MRPPTPETMSKKITRKLRARQTVAPLGQQKTNISFTAQAQLQANMFEGDANPDKFNAGVIEL